MCRSLDRRSHRCLKLLALIALLSVVDYGLTAWCMTTLGMFEANPLVRLLVDATGSLWSLAAYKALFTGVGLLGLAATRRTRTGEAATWAMAGVMVGLTLQWAAYLEAIAVIDPMALQSLPGWVRI